MKSNELLSQATVSVDVTQSSKSRAASVYHSVSRYVTGLATDVAVINGYNTSAHLVILLTVRPLCYMICEGTSLVLVLMLC